MLSCNVCSGGRTANAIVDFALSQAKSVANARLSGKKSGGSKSGGGGGSGKVRMS
jgi:hypothetical protein